MDTVMRRRVLTALVLGAGAGVFLGSVTGSPVFGVAVASVLLAVLAAVAVLSWNEFGGGARRRARPRLQHVPTQRDRYSAHQ